MTRGSLIKFLPDELFSTKGVLWTYWCKFCYIYYHIFNAVKNYWLFFFLRTNESKSLCSNFIIIIIIVAEGNFVFWFGAQFNSMHNFTQSGWPILFSQTSFPGCRNWVSCQTQSLWLNNAVQCRRLTGSSSIAVAAWTHEGTYLIYGFLASIFS